MLLFVEHVEGVVTFIIVWQFFAGKILFLNVISFHQYEYIQVWILH